MPYSLQPINGSSDFDCHRTFDLICNELFGFIELRNENLVETTHQSRKKLKLFRAFAKLIKPARNDADYKIANFLLRDWGRVFSDLRDAHVRRILMHDLHINPDYEDEKYVVEELLKRNRAEITTLEKNTLHSIDEFTLLEKNLKQNPEISHYFSKPADINLVIKGFQTSFLKSKEAFYFAFTSADAEDVHEWRKRAKDIQYQTELLMPATEKDDILRFHTQISDICEHLGNANDMHMLYVWAGKNVVLHNSDQYAALLKKINEANTVSSKMAKESGNYFYDDYPEPVFLLENK
ncbi:MAG: CHAD domain-containing protein [Balneolaceae bacterium]|nr:MAG: CHAD domain-containing protein [Balneolaceae bacterium]